MFSMSHSITLKINYHKKSERSYFDFLFLISRRRAERRNYKWQTSNERWYFKGLFAVKAFVRNHRAAWGSRLKVSLWKLVSCLFHVIKEWESTLKSPVISLLSRCFIHSLPSMDWDVLGRMDRYRPFSFSNVLETALREIYFITLYAHFYCHLKEWKFSFQIYGNSSWMILRSYYLLIYFRVGDKS